MVKYRYNSEHDVCAYNVIATFYIWCPKPKSKCEDLSFPSQVTFGYFCRSALWITACQGAALLLVGIFSMTCRERHKGMFLLYIALWVMSSTFQTPGRVCQNCWELRHKAQGVKIKRKILLYHSVPGELRSRAGSGFSRAVWVCSVSNYWTESKLQGQSKQRIWEAYENRAQICWRAVTFQKCN